MTQVWVKLDLNWLSDTLDPVEAPAYTTVIDGYTVPVYIPWAQPWLWPDTPEEFIVTSGSGYLGGLSGQYLSISTVATGSYYVFLTEWPPVSMYPMFEATAVEISLTQPDDPVPEIITIERYDEFSQVTRSWSILDYVWRLVDVEDAPQLFTLNADVVNFNSLSQDQQDAVEAGTEIYDALGGNDVVTLPEIANSGDRHAQVRIARDCRADCGVRVGRAALRRRHARLARLARAPV